MIFETPIDKQSCVWFKLIAIFSSNYIDSRNPPCGLMRSINDFPCHKGIICETTSWRTHPQGRASLKTRALTWTREQWCFWGKDRGWMWAWSILLFLNDQAHLSSYKRNFGLVSLVAFSTTLIASWESIAWYGRLIVGKHELRLTWGQYLSWWSHKWRSIDLDIWTAAIMARFPCNLCVYGRNGLDVCEFCYSLMSRSHSWLLFRAPTSGGQYHWVAMLAPTQLAVKLSWIAGTFAAY